MRSLPAISSLTIVLTAALFSQQASSPQAYPPPGRMVDIGGRRLHLNCEGKGGPTVILMAGGGAFSIDWALVQPKVVESTRVCSYDRAGLGWSDPGSAEDTVEETVSDLHALLQASDEHGPYVLVGASIGGIFIQAYQRAFPKDVAALVFSNSSNRICPVAIAGMHYPISLYETLAANAVTYALVGLIVETLRRQLHHAK